MPSVWRVCVCLCMSVRVSVRVRMRVRVRLRLCMSVRMSVCCYNQTISFTKMFMFCSFKQEQVSSLENR